MLVLWCSLECTPACQAGGRGFKSRQDRGRIAQLVERAPEKREVAGSTPAPTTAKLQVRRGRRGWHRAYRPPAENDDAYPSSVMLNDRSKTIPDRSLALAADHRDDHGTVGEHEEDPRCPS